MPWLAPTVERFPRSRRFLPGDRLQTTAPDVLERLIEATYTRARRPHLAAANLGIEKLRVLCRLAKDPRRLDARRYAHAARALDEAGRLVGGWRKARDAAAQPQASRRPVRPHRVLRRAGRGGVARGRRHAARPGSGRCAARCVRRPRPISRAAAESGAGYDGVRGHGRSRVQAALLPSAHGRDLLRGFAASDWSGALDFASLAPLPPDYVSAAGAAQRLAAALAEVADPERLAEAGDWIIECGTESDLLARVARPGS